MRKMEILYLLIIMLIILSGCKSKNDNKNDNKGHKNPVIEDISAQEAYTMITSNKDNDNFIILDIRTNAEFENGFIEGAINIDYYADDFSEQLNTLDKNKLYLIYCRSGNRSGKSKAIFKKLDFKEVYNLKGGIISWLSNDYKLINE